MKKYNKTYLILLLILSGCKSTPAWTNATQQQRNNLDFIEDENYLKSPQYTNDINDSVNTVIRLKTLRKED